MSLRELSNVLWRERQLLELLLFKLEEEQLLLAAGRSRWVTYATREVELVLDEVKAAELARAVALDGVTEELGLAKMPSLRELAETAPEPWGRIMAEHREAFLSTTQEVHGLAQANRELLARGYRAAREVLSSMGETRADTYSPTGMNTGRVSAHLVDEVI